MFGYFQDLDHNGSTVLRADFIPPASVKDYGVYFYTHIKSTERVRYEHFIEKVYAVHELHTQRYFW